MKNKELTQQEQEELKKEAIRLIRRFENNFDGAPSKTFIKTKLVVLQHLDEKLKFYQSEFEKLNLLSAEITRIEIDELLEKTLN